jgi:hypothetical protein
LILNVESNLESTPLSGSNSSFSLAESVTPSAGVGLNMTESFGIDVAAFTTASNIERQRKPFAVSLRLGR